MNGPIYPSPNQPMQKYNTNDGINKTSDYYSVAPSRSNGTACKSMLEMSTLQKTNSTSTDSNIEATRHQTSPSNVSNLKVQSPKLKPHGRRNSFIPRFSNFDHRKDTQDEEQFLCVDDSDPNRFDHDLDRNRDDNSRSARAGRNSGRRNGDGGGGKQSKYPEFSFRVENSDGGTSPPPENEVSTTDEACYLKSSHGQKGTCSGYCLTGYENYVREHYYVWYLCNLIKVNVIEIFGTADRRWRTCPLRIETL